MINSMDKWSTEEQQIDSKANENKEPVVEVKTMSLVPQTEDEKVEERRGFERNGFNQYVSDRLPLDRAVPDTRDTRYGIALELIVVSACILRPVP